MRYKQPGSKNKIIPDEEEFDTIILGLEELPFLHSKYTEFIRRCIRRHVFWQAQVKFSFEVLELRGGWRYVWSCRRRHTWR